MKKIAFAASVVFAVFVLACTHSNENVKPASQNSLSLIVPSNTQGSSNLLLLKDGRRANPISGIPSFSQMSVGDKLKLSFTTGASHNGVIDIEVSTFATAEDSVFIPSVPTTDSTAFPGIYTGIAYKSNADSSVTSHDTTSIEFTAPNKYKCYGASEYPKAGSGTFTVWQGMITFVDANPNADTVSVLNGSFSYSLIDSYLYIWRVGQNGTYTSLSLVKK